MNLWKIFVLIAIGLVLVGAGMLGWELFGKVEASERLVRVHSGDTAMVIGKKLQDAEIIRNVESFRILAKLRKADTNLKPGTYIFGGDTNLWQTVSKLRDGSSISIKITIPEGFSLHKTLVRIDASGLMDYEAMNTAASNTSLVKKLTGYDVATLEGFLYPDTYLLPVDCGADSILALFTTEFFTKLRKNNIDHTQIPDFYQKLVLASIIEKEAGSDSERDIIAGVFLNRLKLGMPLQSCPTVDYILEKRGVKKEVLSNSDTAIPSPYNTYLNPGLPPTPISNPSINSILAVLNPAKHNYLYFFSDRKGNNVFSKSYEEHQRLQRQMGL